MPKFSLTRPKWDEVFNEYRKYTVNTGAGADDTTTLKIPVFEDGNLEAALYWCKKFEELIDIKNLDAQAKYTNALLPYAHPRRLGS